MTVSMKKGRYSLASAVALTMVLAACSGGSGSSTKSSGASNPSASNSSSAGGEGKIQDSYNPQPASNIKDGGTFTTATPEISPQFNPFQQDMTLYSSNVWNWYNPVLSTYSPDGNEVIWNKNYLTDVKQSTSGDKTVITYTINPKAMYNDGSPIDWKSFESTWKANNGKDAKYLVNSSDGYSQIESVTKGTDDRQAVVTFEGPYAWWQGLFGQLLNPKVNTPDLFNKGYINTPHNEWGAGPYMVDKFDEKAGTISFKRNPKWWGTPGHLTTRTYVTMEDSASINAFKNGQIDATGVGSKDRLDQVKNMSNIDIRRGSATSNYLMTLNGKSPLLGDTGTRKAIMEGIDRSQLATIGFQGLGYTEPLPGSFTLFNFQKGYEDNFGLKFDANQAKKDLDAAGWKPGSDGFRAKDGKQLKLNFVNLGDNPIRKAQATALAAMMKNIGVNLQIVQRPTSDFSKVITQRDFDLFMSGFGSSDPYGVAYTCQIWCSDSELNKSGTAQASLDPQLKALAKIADPTKQIEEANKLEKQAMQTYGIMPMYNGPVIVATKKGLANYGASAFFSAFPEDIGWQK